MRSRMYGTQPMPPSERATLRRGNLWKTGEKSRSAVVYMELQPNKAIVTGKGASSAVLGDWPELPKGMHSGRAASWAAANTGSHAAVWNDGSPRGAGFATKETARAPHAAHLSTSAAASRTSQIGRVTSGVG